MTSMQEVPLQVLHLRLVMCHMQRAECVCCAIGQAARHARLQSSMEGLMAFLIQTISVKKDHIPTCRLLPTQFTFPFDISIAGWVSIHSQCNLPLLAGKIP